MTSFYSNSLEHILDEIVRIDLCLHLQVLKFRKENHLAENPNNFQGLFISEKEINQLFYPEFIQPVDVKEDEPDLMEIRQAIQRQSQVISEKVPASLEKGSILKIIQIARLFLLNPVEVDFLLICLTPYIDKKYEKIFAYLNNDITQKHPTIDLLLNLVREDTVEKLALHDCFSSQAPLVKYHLLEFLENDRNDSMPFKSKQVKINNRIAGYLLESQIIDPELEGICEFSTTQQHLSELLIPESLKQEFLRFIQRYKNKTEEILAKIVFSFSGPPGSGMQSTAAAICNALGLPLLILDLEACLNYELPLKKILKLAFRESALVPTALFLKNVNSLFDPQNKVNYQSSVLLKIINEYSWLTFLSCNQELDFHGQFLQHRFLPIKFPVPDFSLRKKCWQANLNGHISIADDVDLDDLAGKFNFTNGQIRSAIATANNRAFWRSAESPITIEDFYAGCHAQSNQKLNTLAQKLKPKYNWADIILPKDQMAQLREITTYIKYKNLVYGDWEFDRKLSLGKGLNVLFSGPSGTGKTMAAEIMANELKLEIYKIDLSTVVSKYIGETEKNLAKIFQEAETSNAILFFDEADALFGKRSEVKDAHDRYANIEIGYLLQKMEEYTGMVILATNLRKNMDEAFVRRMHFTVEFPFPEENYRLRIWRNIFPKATPVDKQIDFNFLARKFKISGGNIKNVALAAAFYAADDGQVINMRHIILGTKREFHKMGKLCVKADFGEYYDLMQN